MDVQTETTKSTEDWEKFVGEQFRSMRIRANKEQTELASLAGVSVGAIKNLENGRGSSLRTMIKVCRALHRTDWLQFLAPPITVSPMDLLKKYSKVTRSRVRVRRPRTIVSKE